MTGLILAQLAVLMDREADAVTRPYAWPPRAPLSPEEQREVARLTVLSRRLSYAAKLEGQFDTSGDALWGDTRVSP